MTDRATLIMTGRDVRQKAIKWINQAPAGTRVEFKAPQRSIEQNSRLWAMLTDIVTQHEFNGRRYTTGEAKVVFLHACGVEIQILPSLDGKSFVPYGQSSSDLSVGEMRDLIEFMLAWGAENNIQWSDPKEKPKAADSTFPPDRQENAA